MDIRGIEVTNQLRSAIRAKLLELGVRYDEELPDYILVMVVNKKTRQQMYEDLCLFLEDSTSPFVDWLHDQVLKKLQKVTVAKRKSSRELVPTVIVKQEEERKKKRSCPTSFLEDQTTEVSDKSSDRLSKLPKIQKKTEKQIKQITVHNTETDVTQGFESSPPKRSAHLDTAGLIASESKFGNSTIVESSDSIRQQNEGQLSSPKKAIDKITYAKNVQTLKSMNSIEHLSKSSIEAQINVKISEISSKNSKKSTNSIDNVVNKEISGSTVKSMSQDEADEESEEDSRKKIKSSVNRPRITSVVTVKNRLQFPAPKTNKFDMHKNRLGLESRYAKTVRGVHKHEFEGSRRNDVFNVRNNRSEDYFRRNVNKGHDFDTRTHELDRISDIKSRLGNIRDDKLSKGLESKDQSVSVPRPKHANKLSNSIKDRLGSGNSMRIRENLSNNEKELLDVQRSPKLAEKDVSGANLSIKNRLGPVKKIFKLLDVKKRSNPFNILMPSGEKDESSKLDVDVDTDDDAQSESAIGPVKSKIIAVKRNIPDKLDRNRSKVLKINDVATSNDNDEEDTEDTKIASKIIVTPRPLKPLQPLQKRATQSLLLRAVAEANQSVVKQKNPEPDLTEKKLAIKRPIQSGIREGQNLSVRLNSSKRLVMEKIQVELTTGKSDVDNPEPYVPKSVTDEHMGVVMSLFQRSNDSQKFLVTLNGYNNNVLKEKAVSDEDERLEMEVNEDDDFLLTNASFEEYTESKTAANGFELVDTESVHNISENTSITGSSETRNLDNIKVNDNIPRKKRKLSPIVYNRSGSSSPVHTKFVSSPPVSLKQMDKHVTVEGVLPSLIDKSREKCRYWPNCTLGIKCTYYHPAVLCSTFPACSFGEKCLYKHPKCKFGLSCTKLGCIYTHPPRHCKYHPYCTNPTCTYTHPLPQVQPVEVVSNRAKFTWRKHK